MLCSPSVISSGFGAQRCTRPHLSRMQLEPRPGKRVTVKGLEKRPELNGALGVITGAADVDTGRIPVHLPGAQKRDGILIKPGNLLPAAPQIAVRLEGIKAVAVQLDEQQTLQLHLGGPAPYGRRSHGWMSCRVPSMLGLPLALKQLAPTTHATRLNFEQPAVLLLIDPASGYAPGWAQIDGLGPILVARTDGADFSVAELWDLHDYNGNLMDCWADWAEDPENPEVVEEQREALTPAAFAQYTQEQKGQGASDEEEEEEEEEEG